VIAVDPTSSFTGGAILGDRDEKRPKVGGREAYFRLMALGTPHFVVAADLTRDQGWDRPRALFREVRGFLLSRLRGEGRPRGVQRVDGHDGVADAAHRRLVLPVVAEQRPDGTAERERRGLAASKGSASDGERVGPPPRMDGPPRLRPSPLAPRRHTGGGDGPPPTSGKRCLEEPDRADEEVTSRLCHTTLRTKTLYRLVISRPP